MIGAHGADIDGLYAADTAIILDLYAGEIAEGIGHGVAVEPLKLVAGEHLHRYYIGIGLRGDYLDTAQQHAVGECGARGIPVVGREPAGRQKHEEGITEYLFYHCRNIVLID
jgi:hypothetical protein